MSDYNMDDQPLGPSIIHAVSILDSSDKGDMFTAYCDRHQNDMEDVKPTIKHDGAAYTVQDPFNVYVCGDCLFELFNESNDANSVKEVYDIHLMKMFEKWDRGDAPGDWFAYVGEIEQADNGAGFIAF